MRLHGFQYVLAFLLAAALQDSPSTRLTEPEVVGSERFKNQVRLAVELLKERDTDAYAIVAKHVGRIREAERSGMWAYKSPPTFDMSGTTAYYSVTWCAAAIAHDAFHSKLYHDYLATHGGHVPNDVWTGKTAEQQCMKHQLATMERIGATQREIDHARKVADGHYVRDANDWEEYKKRKW